MATTQVKIIGRNKELFENHLEAAINLAALYARGGTMPSNYDIKEKDNGRWWNLNENEEKYDLYPRANDYKIFIRGKGENWILLEFFHRRDRNREDGLSFEKTMAELIALMLGEDNAEIVTK